MEQTALWLLLGSHKEKLLTHHHGVRFDGLSVATQPYCFLSLIRQACFKTWPAVSEHLVFTSQADAQSHIKFDPVICLEHESGIQKRTSVKIIKAWCFALGIVLYVQPETVDTQKSRKTKMYFVSSGAVGFSMLHVWLSRLRADQQAQVESEPSGFWRLHAT